MAETASLPFPGKRTIRAMDRPVASGFDKIADGGAIALLAGIAGSYSAPIPETSATSATARHRRAGKAASQRRWLDRPRERLDGLTPAQVLGHEWSPGGRCAETGARARPVAGTVPGNVIACRHADPPLSLSAGGLSAIRRPLDRTRRTDPLFQRYPGRRLGGVPPPRGDPRPKGHPHHSPRFVGRRHR